jgi:predicted alpha-1,6-mannanase (GH76 family)
MKRKILVAVMYVGLILTAQSVCAQFTRQEAKVAMQCYNNEFYNQYGTYGNSFKAMYYANTYRNSRSDFWREVESIETLIDAYHTNNDPEFRDRIRYLYHGIRDAHGLTWTNNPFNDDVIWGAIMCIRAFGIFNDGGMKQMAIDNFNLVWNRGWDNTIDGGIWWKTDKKSKNACVNAPAAICAMLIYYATGDISYRTKAQMIMNWMRTKLYDAGTGEVKGAIIPGNVITEGSRTYTQGTFIGAAGELHKYFPTENWLTVGLKATDYAKNVMSNGQGLLPDEYCGSDDCPGFKGIFARWVCKFVKDHNRVSTYGAWLDYNAKEAWRYRNSKGLMWAQWWRRTPDGTFLTSWETTSGVSMMNCVFLWRTGNNVGREDVREEEISEKEKSVRVYPSPATTELTIKGDKRSAGDISIRDATGKVVLRQKLISEKIDITVLPKGIYTIQVRTPEKIITERFVKD